MTTQLSLSADTVRGIALAIAASSMIWALLARSPEVVAGDTQLVPALPEVTARCIDTTGHAQHQARNALRAAIARAERYTFAPGDGLIALERFEQARACAQLASDSALQTAATERAARFRARLERDYQEHAARYRFARRVGRLSDAAPDIAFLLELLAQRSAAELHTLRSDQLDLEREASARSSR